ILKLYSYQPVSLLKQMRTPPPTNSTELENEYLSDTDQAALEAEVGRLSFRNGTTRAATGPEQLRARLEEAGERGFAVDREETFDGVVCAAVPMRIGGTLVGAAGVSGPAHRLPDEKVERVGAVLLERLSSLSAVGRP